MSLPKNGAVVHFILRFEALSENSDCYFPLAPGRSEKSGDIQIVSLRPSSRLEQYSPETSANLKSFCHCPMASPASVPSKALVKD
jgi:hypothetical protein